MADTQLSEAQTATFNALILVGFSVNQSTNAAQTFGSNVDDAVNYLLDNPNIDLNNATPAHSQTDEQNLNPKSETPITIFRVSDISRMLLHGFFHHSLLNNSAIFPSDIQNIMLQYTNLLFAKLRYSIDDTQSNPNSESGMKYLALESDMTLGAIALSIEKENEYIYEEKEETLSIAGVSDGSKEKKDYPQFIHLWLRFKDIHFIYDKQTEIPALRWLELPADYENKTVNDLDQQTENENNCVEIAVEKYDQNESKWPFAPNYDEETIKVCIETGDIIDAYCEEHNQWYESVVKSVKTDDRVNVHVHYIGFNSSVLKDAVLAVGIVQSDSFLICPRGTHTNGPYRKDWWRRSLFVGYKLDVFDAAYRKWYSGQVAEIMQGKVKVHYDGYSENYDEWLDTESDRLEPLNTYTAPDPFWS